MDVQVIYGLMERFNGLGIERMELETDGLRLCLERGSCEGRSPRTAAPLATFGKQETAPFMSTGAEAGEPIKAPLVGTFFQAPVPGEPPFVTEGQWVKKGDVIGIIEAMKLMNEIVAPHDGQIAQILVPDGQMVEYGQVLMTLKPGGEQAKEQAKEQAE